MRGVRERSVSLTFHLTLGIPYVYEDVKDAVEETVDAYFQELANQWGKQPSQDPLLLRISALEMRILSLPGIVDLRDTLIDGQGKNLILMEDEIPVRGEIIGQTDP